MVESFADAVGGALLGAAAGFSIYWALESIVTWIRRYGSETGARHNDD